MPSSSRLTSEILLAASSAGLTLWRNNTGTGWVGDVTRTPGGILIRNPRPLHAGLCKGSSDLIGLRPRLILPEDVGSILAQFVALEIKAGRDRLRPEQVTFLDFVRGAGGVALEVRSVGDLELEPSVKIR